jgi:hypothetical protein
VVYLVHDVSHLETCETLKAHLPVSKVMCYSSLAYLTPPQVERVLGFVAAHATPDVRILLGSVLDKARRWQFFNTWSRKLNYLVRVKLFRREFGLGRWWTRGELVAMAARNGFSCDFIEQSPLLHTAHYRYDVLMRRTH